MKFFKPYTDVKDFLQRFTILKIGKLLHIRLHKIVGDDETGFYHNHPFNYISIVLWGGYVERILNKDRVKFHGAPCIISRSHKTFHNIQGVVKPTYTLFITFGKYDWKAINLNEPKTKDGVYSREVNGKKLYCKRESDIWFIGHKDENKAKNETRHSIHQI